MAIVEIDSENADRDLTSQVTVLTHTPSATEPMMCIALVVLGDGAKNLDGSGGLFEFDISIGGNTVQPAGQQMTFSDAGRSSAWSEPFPVPAGAEVVIKVKSPNAADTDVDVTAYLYSTRLGPFCAADCTACCYQIKVYIYYLYGDCPAKYSCTNYNGIWILEQEGAAGTDCVWLYTHPVDGFNIRIHCELGYWWLTIEHDGNIAARWRRSLEYDPDCPPVTTSNWNYVDGDCTGNPWAYTDCYGWDRPVYPPQWYPEILLGVLRMRLKWG